VAGNTFGKLFSITTYGESHGKGIGVVIDGCPAGLVMDEKFIQAELNKRKPGQSAITTQRKEADEFIINSGVFEGVSTGAPINIFIANKDAKSKDYDNLKDVFRPSHADYAYEKKYGIRDYKGGGRSSARETAARVAAGAIAKLFLNHYKIEINAFVSQVGQVVLELPLNEIELNHIESNVVRCPDSETAKQMINAIEEAKEQGDTLGGMVTCIVKNCPVGLGEPVFDKLHADLGKAMLSINAVKGFEFGSGFTATIMKGSEHNDEFVVENDIIATSTNFSGGIQGGISNGMPINFNVAFKPVSTIMQQQQTVNKEGEQTNFEAAGRHDPCVVSRAVVIVEAMTALVLADHLLRNKTAKL